LILTYCLIDFSDAERDPQFKSYVGWFAFVLMVTTTFVNMFFLVFNQAKVTIKALKDLWNAKDKKVKIEIEDVSGPIP